MSSLIPCLFFFLAWVSGNGEVTILPLYWILGMDDYWWREVWSKVRFLSIETAAVGLAFLLARQSALDWTALLTRNDWASKRPPLGRKLNSWRKMVWASKQPPLGRKLSLSFKTTSIRPKAQLMKKKVWASKQPPLGRKLSLSFKTTSIRLKAQLMKKKMWASKRPPLGRKLSLSFKTTSFRPKAPIDKKSLSFKTTSFRPKAQFELQNDLL